MKKSELEKFNFYRDYGSLTNNSVVTDFYNKRISAKRKKKMSIAKGGKCITRQAILPKIPRISSKYFI